jgi:hypothetical protein
MPMQSDMVVEGQGLPPRHEHDCDRCVFLGQHEEFDLYVCPGEPTLLARRSDEGSDYWSGSVRSADVERYTEAGGGMGALAEARRRVQLIANVLTRDF